MKPIYESKAAWYQVRDAALKKYVLQATALTRQMDNARAPKGTFRVPGGETVGAVCDVAQQALAPLLNRGSWELLSLFLQSAAQTAWLALWRSGQLTPGRMETSRRSMIESLAQTLTGNKINPGFLDKSVKIRCSSCDSEVDIASMLKDDVCRNCCSITVVRGSASESVLPCSVAPACTLDL